MTQVDESERPPVFRRWSGWYAVVLGMLCLLIALMYVFTKAFE